MRNVVIGVKRTMITSALNPYLAEKHYPVMTFTMICTLYLRQCQTIHINLHPGINKRCRVSKWHIFASKAPKRICYSASESLKNRVSATVAQKNIGYHYISELHLEAGLSPNKITKKQSECLSKERKRDVGFSLVTEINNIPGIRYRPNIETVTNFDGNFAVFDLETSSLQEDCEILQIACKFNDNEFSCYIQPTKPISKMSSAVTGLTNEGGVLFHHGKPIREAAFQNFVIWLSQYKPVILIGHNAKLFDSKRLILNIKNFTCFAEFKTVVKGFVDTLPLFKKQFPGFPNYKQTTVYENVCGGQFDAHNAIGDVSALNCILEKSSIGKKELLLHSFSIESLMEQQKFDTETKRNEKTYESVVNDKFLTKYMARRMAESGLVLDDLKSYTKIITTVVYSRSLLKNVSMEHQE
ncbi:Hypothetical predicted protein [Mytilus galloprovincialis]|uniref:Exonuclease domain-containing protein n=1 Tax=Mytilus galloprovincialis TaxID=29158 RepID=A0A8B6C6A8_MYTGA|nr:Hypothetical predicted protein [Mytilus galloprovincialis]